MTLFTPPPPYTHTHTHTHTHHTHTHTHTHARTRHTPTPGQIVEVVLAEVRGAPVSHRANIRLLMQSIAPRARLTVLPLTRLQAGKGRAAAAGGAEASG
jgi:hypothetical protein